MTTPAVGLRVVAALRSGASGVARPHGVVHLYSGPCTRSGRAVPRARRPLCGVRTRRLSVVVRPGRMVELGGRRFCRRCTTALPAQRLVSRDDWVQAFRSLTVADLAQAARWCRSVDETHQVATLASRLFGPPLLHVKRPTVQQSELVRLDDLILTVRRDREIRDRTPADLLRLEGERAAAHDAAAASLRIAEARRQEDRLSRAVASARRGGYVMPWDRDLIKSA